MLGFALALIATCLHVALCFAVAPLLIGYTNKLRAWLLGLSLIHISEPTRPY